MFGGKDVCLCRLRGFENHNFICFLIAFGKTLTETVFDCACQQGLMYRCQQRLTCDFCISLFCEVADALWLWVVLSESQPNTTPVAFIFSTLLLAGSIIVDNNSCKLNLSGDSAGWGTGAGTGLIADENYRITEYPVGMEPRGSSGPTFLGDSPSLHSCSWKLFS